MTDIDQLIDFLNSKYPVSLGFRMTLKPMVKRKSYSHLKQLIKPETIVTKVWRLLKGHIIVTKLAENSTEVVKKIYYPGDFGTDVNSFFKNVNSIYHFYAVGEIVTLELKKSDFEKLNFPETHELAKRLLLLEKDNAIERADLIAIRNPFERVKRFLQTKPGIGIPNHFAASFLAMEEEIYVENKYLLTEQAVPFASPQQQVDMNVGDLAYRCKFFIKQHFASKDIGNIEQIAAKLCVSSRTLNREMKKTFGMTAHMLLIQFRMEYAKKLLKQRMPVHQVANNTGYADSATFSKLFKKHFNHCPKDAVKKVPHNS